MRFKIEYLRDWQDARSVCFSDFCPSDELGAAVDRARNGLENARRNYGAEGFQILDGSEGARVVHLEK